MPKLHLSRSRILILVAVLVFLGLIVAIFFMTYRLGQKTSTQANQQLTQASRDAGPDYQQVRKLRLTHQLTGEITEIDIDGTVRQYDKTGKLLKSGRRGFAETQNIFKQYEWFVNQRQSIEGGNYRIEILTQTGTVVINPGGSGQGSQIINDTEEFIDHTVNPTPRPSAPPSPTLPPGASPLPTLLPSPTPLPDKPSYLDAPPFTCADYYTKGSKPLKISGIYCGVE